MNRFITEHKHILVLSSLTNENCFNIKEFILNFICFKIVSIYSEQKICLLYKH